MLKAKQNFSVLAGIFALLVLQPVYADITVAAGGDVMLGNTLVFPEAQPIRFGETATQLLEQADVAFINLEGPIGGSQAKAKVCPSGRCYTFRQPENSAAYLTRSGIDLVSLANNHALDMQEGGQEFTRLTLKQHRIGYAGYLDSPYVTIHRAGKRIGLVAFSANKGVMDFRDEEMFTTTLEKARAQSDILLVSLHMGAEGKDQAIPVTDRQEIFLNEDRGNPYRLARRAIDLGADLVLGHGPHVPRGLDIYKNRLIAYSLGNFLTAKGISVSGISGVAPLLVATLDDQGKIKHARIHSFRQNQSELLVDETAEAKNLIMSLSSAEANVLLQKPVQATESEIILPSPPCRDD